MGFNEDDISLVITTSGTQNPNQQNQRKGRGLRKFKDKKTIIVNIYVKNTIDEKWLFKRQHKSNNTIYMVDNIDKINYIFKDNFSELDM